MMVIKTTGRGLVILAILVAGGIGFSAIKYRQQWSLASRYWRRTKPITMYGRVVDQRGNPVAGAKVNIAVSGFNPGSLTGSKNYLEDERRSYTTNEDGMFKVAGLSGTYLRIERIACDGYEKLPEARYNRLDLLGFGYSQDRGVPYYVPDPQKPAIFPLCKPGEKRTIWPSRGGTDQANPW